MDMISVVTGATESQEHLKVHLRTPAQPYLSWGGFVSEVEFALCILKNAKHCENTAPHHRPPHAIPDLVPARPGARAA